MKTWVKGLLLIIVLALVSVIVYFIYMGMQNKGPVEPVEDNNKVTEEPADNNNNNDWQDAANNVIDSATVLPQNMNLNDSEADLLAKAQVEQLSVTFIEVFGSYSTDSRYQNLFDLKEIVTTSYWSQLERYISAEAAANDYSVWTNALKATVSNLSNEAAQVLVKTQRGERTDKKTAERRFSQDAEVFLLKENGVWLVNKVNWLEE